MASRVAQARHGSGTDIGRQVRAGRTVNMPLMSVTLEVSRLSGRLNAEANCQVAGTVSIRDGYWATGTRGSHLKHLTHVRDAGGVQAERPVERRCSLPGNREAHGG